MQVSIEEIKVVESRRSLDELNVGRLAESIEAVGLQNPIVLTEDYKLVSGRHRLEAAKRLGYDTIEANILPLSPEEAALAEIDENLIRREMTALEQGLLLKRRKEILDAMGLLAKAGGQVGNQNSAKEKNEPDNMTSSFKTNKEIAADIGLNERTARRREQIAKNLDPEVAEMLQDTELANQPVKLLELSQKAPEVQKAIVEVIKTEKARTVKEAETYIQPAENALKPAEVAQYEVIYVEPDYKYGLGTLDKLLDRRQVSENCTLFLWALDKKLDVGMDLGRLWGFKYRESFIWDRRCDTQGIYHQQNHAHLLIFTRGKHEPIMKRPDWGSIWSREARNFDVKPDCFKQIISDLFEGKPVLEI